jgi:hypothetical protein
VAIRNGGRDSAGLPRERPVAGGTYRILGIYQMRYGLGCRLAGMDPFPYKGYFLFVRPGTRNIEPGWYFEKLEKADDDFTEFMRTIAARQETLSERD